MPLWAISVKSGAGLPTPAWVEVAKIPAIKKGTQKGPTEKHIDPIGESELILSYIKLRMAIRHPQVGGSRQADLGLAGVSISSPVSFRVSMKLRFSMGFTT